MVGNMLSAIVMPSSLASYWFPVRYAGLSGQGNISVRYTSSGGSRLEHSHPDHVLHVKVLQGRAVGVVTLVVLQHHLLDDPVEQQPVLHRVPAPLV